LTVAAIDGLPLYRRIEADLRDRIRTGELTPGARVETEVELMERYGVSRATVRQALGGLIATGALEVRRGLGTYVASARFEHTIGGFYSFSREIERAGRRPGTRVLDLRLEPADETVAAALGIGVAATVVALRRLRLADAEPLVVETSRLPAARFPGLEEVDFSTVRLYDVLTTAYGCRPTRARETFEPILLRADEAQLLGQRRGGPALRLERIAFDQDDDPIEHCRSTVRGDRYRYAVELRDR
jgi:GntR family transcriptional regulator